MPRKIVNTKSDIPKWYVKRIKDFENLTENEALFEYEGLKIRERARKYAKRKGIEYTPPKIVRPQVVIPPDVDRLKRIEHADIVEAVREREPIVRYTDRLYDYEPEYWKEENLPDYTYRPEPGYWEEPDYSYDYYSEDNYLTEDEERQIEQSFNVPQEPEHDASDYWIDPNTGEAILWEELAYEEAERAAREFLEDLKDYLRQEADQTAISHSYYQNGKTRSPSQRRFYDQNIDSALEKIINKIDSILNDPNKFANFVNAHRGATNDWEALVMASSEYIHSSYKTKGGDPVQAAQLNALLDAGPISLDEALDFVDSAYDIDE